MKRPVYWDMFAKQNEVLCHKGYDFDTFLIKEVQEREDILYNLQEEYGGTDKPVNHIKPIVSVCIPTYQHVQYIGKCLDGALMQETTFPIEIIIGDDGSVDGTVDVCKDYAERFPDKIRFFNRERVLTRVFDSEAHIERFCNWWWTLRDARGKYVAICEGDDYWIDPLKLQKQVDFLENHPDYVMSHTSIQYYFQNQKLFVQSRDAEINAHLNDDIHAEDILFSDRYRIQTVTVVYRKDIAELVLSCDSSLYRSGRFLQGDTPLWYGLLQHGKIHFLPEVTAIYRRNDGSVTATKDIKKYMRFMLSYAELRMYLVHRDNLSSIEERVNRIYAQILLCYKAFNSNYIPDYQIDVRKYAKTYYYLYRIGMLSFFLLAKNFVKTCLRPWKNRMANSI